MDLVSENNKLKSHLRVYESIIKDQAVEKASLQAKVAYLEELLDTHGISYDSSKPESPTMPQTARLRRSETAPASATMIQDPSNVINDDASHCANIWYGSFGAADASQVVHATSPNAAMQDSTTLIHAPEALQHDKISTSVVAPPRRPSEMFCGEAQSSPWQLRSNTGPGRQAEAPSSNDGMGPTFGRETDNFNSSGTADKIEGYWRNPPTPVKVPECKTIITRGKTVTKAASWATHSARSGSGGSIYASYLMFRRSAAHASLHTVSAQDRRVRYGLARSATKRTSAPPDNRPNPDSDVDSDVDPLHNFR